MERSLDEHSRARVECCAPFTLEVLGKSLNGSFAIAMVSLVESFRYKLLLVGHFFRTLTTRTVQILTDTY